jgi:hypothetical protein
MPAYGATRVRFDPARCSPMGQARDGGDEDRAEYKAHDTKGGEQDALQPIEPLASGIVEELSKFLVDLNHRQQPRQAGTEAPEQSLNWSLFPGARRRDGPPE